MTGRRSRTARAVEVSPGTPTGPAWDRLEDQLDWYDRKSSAAQRAFKRIKLAEMVLAASIPVLSAAGPPAWVLGALGGAVVVLEGVQQLYQYQSNWITYRGTAEALKHEKYLYLAHAGPYTGRERERVLAERVEGLVSQEHAKWTASQHTAADRPAPEADADGTSEPTMVGRQGIEP